VAIPVERICNAKGSGKEAKMQEFTYRDTTNFEHEMNDYAGNNWNHRNSKKRLRKTLVAMLGEFSIHSLQKTAELRTSHIIRKVL